MGKRGAAGGWLEPLRPGKRLRRVLDWVSGRPEGAFPRAGSVLTVPGEGVCNEGQDNVAHDYICRVGDRIRDWEILGLLGRGTFGQVLKCKSTEGELAALKVIKHEGFCEGMEEQALEEVSVLRRLGGPGAESNIVRMLASFKHAGHQCIAMELLGPDLLTVLEAEGKPGLPMAFIRASAQQLLAALERLRICEVIHGDIKPENVLVAQQGKEPRVKLIDFGTAQVGRRVAETEDVVIQTLPYRAPEVLLGLPYTCAVDMWSFGCLLAELVLGRPLFPHGGSEHDVVRSTLELLGPIPEQMLENGRHTERYFSRVARKAGLAKRPHHGGGKQPATWLQRLVACCRRRPKLPKPIRALFRAVQRREPHPSHQYCLKSSGSQEEECDRIKSLGEAFRHLRYEISWTPVRRARRLRPEVIETQVADRRQLHRFIQSCLDTNPEVRWLPSEAAYHPFVRDSALSSRRLSPPVWRSGGPPSKRRWSL